MANAQAHLKLAPKALRACEDCFFAYRGEAYSLCQVDFRTFGGGRPGWSVEAGTASKSAWTALWGSDRYIAGVYQPAERQNCSDVVVGEQLGLESGGTGGTSKYTRRRAVQVDSNRTWARAPSFYSNTGFYDRRRVDVS